MKAEKKDKWMVVRASEHWDLEDELNQLEKGWQVFNVFHDGRSFVIIFQRAKEAK